MLRRSVLDRGRRVATARADRDRPHAVGRRGRDRAGALVERLLENLARLEGEDPPLADPDWLARLRVASRALTLVTQDEVSEPADLDLLSAAERLLHHLEDEVHELSRLLAREPADLAV